MRRRSLTFRVEYSLFSKIQNMATRKKISLSNTIQELLVVGLNALINCDDSKNLISNQHLELGASSAIEALLLLRKITKETHPEWVKEIHKQVKERIKATS